ncbi:MAG: hypothetical protein WD382_06705 [Halofilum sp. (in: g-proteobacteria)]
MNEIAIFEMDEKQVEVRLEKGTLWPLRADGLFGRDKSVICRHLRNDFKDGELDSDSVVAKIATTGANG